MSRLKISSKEAKEVFGKLYDNIDGHSISNRGREAMKEADRKFLIYGEMPISELEIIMKTPAIADDVKKAKVFYDLGSGTGKVVIGAALLFPTIEKVFGIEIVKTLYESSQQVKEQLSSIDRAAATRVEFINDDFFNVNFSKPFPADIVLMHYPMKDAEELYIRLEEKMRRELKSGAIVISSIRRLKNLKAFSEITNFAIKCSFGDVTIYFYRKI
ncbi:MAG: class I SAM-dependent methyltransferase [Rickettsiales bacterium]|jgi:SAM-dependent methyltransferase|nr:class I SAM-dependent methyltransferase [Rickettsiales bacterium]